jgi:rhodanese-related sulfurtransferase
MSASHSAASHSPGFLALVEEARQRINEVPAAELAAALVRTPGACLIDVREESEFKAGHVVDAKWLGKGIIERDIEVCFPDKQQPLYLYCGGGFRSALAADNLTRMGYTAVWSVNGGWRELQNLLPIE